MVDNWTFDQATKEIRRNKKAMALYNISFMEFYTRLVGMWCTPCPITYVLVDGKWIELVDGERMEEHEYFQ